MKLKCDKCGDIDYALYDGYGFGDRVLEGVDFVVKATKTKIKTVEVVAPSKDYFHTLNEKMYLKQANEMLEDIQELNEEDSSLRCPNPCDGFVQIYTDKDVLVKAKRVRPAPVMIKTSGLTDLIGVLNKLPKSK